MPLTPVQRATIVALHETGFNISRIADRVGVTLKFATPPASASNTALHFVTECRAEAAPAAPAAAAAGSEGCIATPERALLAKLEKANRCIEADAKYPPSLPGHSRKNSDTSQVSAASSSYDEARGPLGAGSEQENWSLWSQLTGNWEAEWRRRNPLIRDLVRRGVPDPFRGLVWQLLADIESSPEKKLYASYIEAKSACEKVIRRDIAITYPNHQLFKEKDGLGQKALFNVMKAYSLHDREVGYCQGSGFIVGLLLMRMPEEEAFAVLVKIMQQHRMRDMFKPSMAELGLCMFQLENLVQEQLPDLHGHFHAQGFDTSIYAIRWFQTLFTTSFSLPVACRVMDVFLSEGSDIVFKVALALLVIGKNDLLSLDMEGMLKYFQKELQVQANADPEALMTLAYSMKVIPERMKKLEEENKSKEQGDQAVISCLKQGNRLLKQHAELLEARRPLGAGSEQENRSLWSKLTGNWEAEWRRHNPLIRDLVRRGVPDPFRGRVWQLLADIESSPEKKLYASYIEAKSACEKVIRRDIAITYPNHQLFKEKDGLGQKALFNVMKAYSLHDREVGYCQGSGFIVGLLLMRMSEEEAFAVLVKIMQQHRMRDMFKPSMAELGLCLFQLENLIQEQLPDLHGHFHAQGFDTSIYAIRWFQTLFTTSFSLPVACRVMDVFLSEGSDIVFKVALALLVIGKNDLLSLDMEGMLKYFQKELKVQANADPEALMTLAYSMKVIPERMKKLEEENKSKEQCDQAVISCLQHENRLLKQHAELLERESSALAEQLVRGQVDRAEAEEETFELAREVQALRRAHVDAEQRLAIAQDLIHSLEMSLAETDELIAVKLREAEGNLSLKELRQKVTELSEAWTRHLQVKYETMQANIHNVEDAQRIAELENQVSEYKLKNDVMLTEGQLRSNPDESEHVRELQEKIAELKAEIVRLEVWKARALGRAEDTSRLLSVEDELREADEQLAGRRDSALSLLRADS